MSSPNIALRTAAACSRILPDAVRQAIYDIPYVNTIVRSVLNSFAPQSLTVVEVASGPLEGARLYLDLHAEKYYWLGTYEPHLIQVIHSVCRGTMTVYDVGANLGYLSLIFARAVGSGGHVFSFEPLEANSARIRKHVELNGLEGVITVVPSAVAAHNGSALFLTHSSHAMGKLEQSAGRAAEYTGHVEVSTIGLDEFCYELNNPVPDLVKIDIEGGAVDAVQGMTRLVAEARPVMLVELHGHEEGHAVWNLLTQNGYSIQRMDKNRTEIRDLAQLDWKDYIIGLPHPSRLPMSSFTS